MLELVFNCTSGDSCFATFLTSSNPTDAFAAPIVAVTAASKPYGTSTPGVLWPSAREYSTRTRESVTSLLAVGASPAVAPRSFKAIRSVAVPLSPKIVGQGESVVHGGGVVTLVTT